MEKVIKEHVYGLAPHDIYTINFNIDGDSADSVVIEQPSMTAFVAAMTAQDKACNIAEMQGIREAMQTVAGVTISDDEELNAERDNLINIIKKYDVSDDVDSIYVGEQRIWLDFETRERVMDRLDLATGDTEKITYGGETFELPVTNLRQMMTLLRVYARDCFDTTQKHLKEVETLSLDAIRTYDYKTGYPTVLKFNV